MAADLTALLRRVSAGEAEAQAELYECSYEALHAQATRFMRGRDRDQTLQPTALVHETYLRLARSGGVSWTDRAHFFAAAARAMRCILVDRARARGRQKRKQPGPRVPVDCVAEAIESRGVDILALDEALDRLGDHDARAARVVELRFFGGLSMPEVARHLGIGTRTAEREWEFARAWLHRRLA